MRSVQCREVQRAQWTRLGRMQVHTVGARARLGSASPARLSGSSAGSAAAVRACISLAALTLQWAATAPCCGDDNARALAGRTRRAVGFGVGTPYVPCENPVGTHAHGRAPVVPDAGACSFRWSSCCRTSEFEARCAARAAAYSPACTCVGRPESSRATIPSSASTSAGARVAAWTALGAASIISSSLSLAFQWETLSHLQPMQRSPTLRRAGSGAGLRFKLRGCTSA